ncbi:MAG TPA: efflux RND transporter periplasmic adaptor subunit [Gemmatimonadaceae bacterium]|nr:efflux RND transporter periplasmic adaptor subunit [Gemmatimonadaceae bacterium]
MRRVLWLAVVLAAVGCRGDNDVRTMPTTVLVERRDIIVDVEATGVVEPINVIEVKSKASGQITRLTVETGDEVRRGTLLVQLDRREVEAQYQQANADLQAAQARRDVAASNRERSDNLFEQRVITAQEHESARLDLANAEAALVRARAALDQAQQRREDVTVLAPIDGTIIERTVAEGQVIASATSSASGGTTLLRMADLTRVRVRVNVSEADIGSVRTGMPASVATDAYPNRPFIGFVEKIEPQAVVQQSVTMFPILVSIENRDGLLKPGMNSEVTIEIDRRLNVLAVPNDAVRTPREATMFAGYLGISADSMRSVLATAGINDRGGFAPGAMSAPGRISQTSPGDVVLAADVQQGPQQGAPQGRQGGPGAQVQVTDEQCAAVTAALARNADAEKQLTDLRAKMQSGELDRVAAMQQQQAIYQRLGIDARVAGSCRMRQQQAPPANVAGAGGPATPQAGTGAPAVTPAQGPGGAGGAGAQEFDRGRRGGRTGVVFVSQPTGWSPRVIQMGVANFDFTEILSGLEEGQYVALLGAIALQAQREQAAERMRNMRGGIPGLQREQSQPSGAPAGIGGPGGPGGPGGGGR